MSEIVNFEGRILEGKSYKNNYHKRLVFSPERSKTDVIIRVNVLVHHSANEVYPLPFVPIFRASAVNVIGMAGEVHHKSQTVTHGLNSPFGLARYKIQSGKAMERQRPHLI